MDDEQDRVRRALSRRIPSPLVDEWVTVANQIGAEHAGGAAWVERFGPELHEAGLSAEDAGDLFRRLGPQVAQSLPRLISQGRMADINLRYVHLWAASGLLKPTRVAPGGRPGRAGAVSFTKWISEARRYITVCGGDQHLAAAAAAAGLTVEETVANRDAGELNLEALEMLTALRATIPDSP